MIAPEQIGLIEADTSGAGYTRTDPESFVSHTGKRVSAKKAKWMLALAIPPAWADVWIAPDPKTHILAYGLDEAGRRQYIYHPDFREAREMAKFEKLPDFARALPKLRRDVSRILDDSDELQSLAIASVVRLLDEGGLRIGNARFYKRSGARGATTLQDKNVTLKGNLITLKYTAKGGKSRHIEIEDPELVDVIKLLQDTKGRDLFSSSDFNIESRNVNDYLQSVMGDDVSAKDFRTWGGSVVATETLRKNDTVTLKLISEEAASYLGNTKTIARNSYIHPAIIDLVKSGDPLPSAAGPTRLYAAERVCFGIMTHNRYAHKAVTLNTADA